MGVQLLPAVVCMLLDEVLLKSQGSYYISSVTNNKTTLCKPRTTASFNVFLNLLSDE